MLPPTEMEAAMGADGGNQGGSSTELPPAGMGHKQLKAGVSADIDDGFLRTTAFFVAAFAAVFAVAAFAAGFRNKWGSTSGISLHHTVPSSKSKTQKALLPARGAEDVKFLPALTNFARPEASS